MVNKERLTKAVEALESGQYRQTQGTLARVLVAGDDETRQEAYCCLGVFCEVALADGLELDVTYDGDRKVYHGSASVLPPKVALYKADESVGRTRAIRKYCCLGVACEVAIKDGLNLQKTTLEHVNNESTAYNQASGELPVEVAKFYGIPTNPLLVCETSSGRYEVAHATTANDSLKLSFREIADAFERTYRLNETSD
jgi:hypothetical protein